MKPVIIYGAGQNGNKVYRWLQYIGAENKILAFCDKASDQTGTEIAGIPVCSYNDVKNMDAVFIVTPEDKTQIVQLLEGDQKNFCCSFEEFVHRELPGNSLAEQLISKESIQVSESCVELKEAYQKDNYKTVYYGNDSEKCYLFFSGNGLYHQNTLGELRRTLLAEDRYEWEHLARISEVPNIAAKSIFIRDIYKNFYVNGISEQYGNIDKLIALLKKETRGYHVTAVGNSAGGYMAMLAGAMLGADMVLCFSGIADLYCYNDAVYGSNYYFMHKYRDDADRNKYYNITDILEGSGPVAFFYAANNEEDIRQAALVGNKPDFLMFPVASSVHGRTIQNDQIAKLLTVNSEKLSMLAQKYAGKIVPPEGFGQTL